MKYKVVMYGHVFVDMMLLTKGIYGTDKPNLFNESDTLEEIIRRSVESINALGMSSKTFVENLKQCTLVDVTLTINEKEGN